MSWCTRCEELFEDGDQFITTHEGVYEGTPNEQSLTRGTYHIDCWPGVASTGADPFVFDTQGEPHQPFTDVAGTPEEQPPDTIPSEPNNPVAKSSSQTCFCCGEEFSSDNRLVLVSKWETHRPKSGMFSDFRKLLTDNLVSGSERAIETGSLYHRDCWPGLSGEVADPLDFVVDSQGDQTVEEFRTPFGTGIVTSDEVRFTRSPLFFVTHWHRRHPLLTVAIDGGVLTALLAWVGLVPSVSAFDVLLTIGIMLVLIVMLTIEVYRLDYSPSQLQSITLSHELVDKVVYRTGGWLTAPHCYITYQSNDAWTEQPFVLSWQWSGLSEADLAPMKAAFESHGIPVIKIP